MKYLFLILSLFTLSVSAQTLMPVPSTPTTANINFALGGGLACSGTNTYAASLPGLTAYSGFAADLQFANANTSTTTSVNINSLGAKSLKKYSSGSLVDLSIGDISSGARIRFYYNGSYMVMMGGTGSGTDPNAIHQGSNTLIGAFELDSKSQIDFNVSSHSTGDQILESYFIDSVAHTATRSETVTSGGGVVQSKIEPSTDASDANVTISTFNASNNVSLSIGSSSSDNVFTDGRATPIGFRQSSDIYASGNQSDRAWIDLGTYDRRSMKRVARCATTANITLSGLQTVDGLSLVAGDVVLVKNQTTGSQNGLYIVASGAWTRPDEFNSTTDYSQGAVFPVRFGTTQPRTMWICTNLTPITFGTTAITIAQFAGNLAAMTGILPVVNGGTGTATPALVAGTNVTITGSWPNQTINSTGGGGGSVTAGYGITTSGGGTVVNVDSTKIQKNIGFIDVRTYGAVADGKQLYDGAITSGSATFTSATASFVAGDIGKVIHIKGIGASSKDTTTTITGRTNSTTITIGVNASATVSSAQFTYGTDQTTKLQAAYDAAMNLFNATVLHQSGIYIVNGAFQTNVNGHNPNSQLFFRTDSLPNRLHNVKLLGVSPPEMTETALAEAPTIIKGATIIYSTKTYGTGTYPSILGTKGIVAGSDNFNLVSINIENMIFRNTANATYHGPWVSGVNAENFLDCVVENCRFDIDVPAYNVRGNSSFFNHMSFGLKMTKTNGGTFITAKNVLAVGHKYGYVMGEHTTGDQIQAFQNEVGIGFTSMNHAARLYRVGSFWNKNAIGIFTPEAGGCFIDISQLDLELRADGSVYDNTNTINDPSNQMNGMVNVYYVETTGAVYTVNGGTNLTISRLIDGGLPLDRNLAYTGLLIPRLKNRTDCGSCAVGQSYENSAGTALQIVVRAPSIAGYGNLLSGSPGFYTAGTNGIHFMNDGAGVIDFSTGTGGPPPTRLSIGTTGVITASNLAGTGTRLVTANASGNLSNVVGERLTNTASTSSTGTNTITWGDTNVNNGNFGSALFGESSEINTGVGSALSVGEGNYIAGYGGVAFGRGTYAGGGESFIGGRYVSATAAKTNTKAPQSTGVCAFGFYITDTNQIANHGSGGVASAILGGRNANIPAGADFSVILGGDRMKLSSSDTAMVYVPNFRVRALRGATNIIADASGNIVASKRIAGSFTATGTATTTFTVTFGNTQAGTSYKVTMSPTSILAVGGYVTNKTTTTFDYVVPAATGTVSLDYEVIP